LQFIIKPKSYTPEFLGIILLTPVYGLFAGSAYFYLKHTLALAILHYIASCTMFYSLINASPGNSF